MDGRLCVIRAISMKPARGSHVVVLAWFRTTTHPMGLRAIPVWRPWAQQGRRDERGGRSRYPGTAPWYRVIWLPCSTKAWPTIGPSTEPVRIHIADSTKLYGLVP